MRAPRPAPLFSATPITGKKLAPLLGENSVEILKELKFSDKDINTLIRDKVTSKN